MTDLETYKNQDEVFIESSRDPVAGIAIVFLFALHIAIGLSPVANSEAPPLSMPQAITLLIAILYLVYYVTIAKPKSRSKKEGLYINENGIEMVDSIKPFKLNWLEIKDISKTSIHAKFIHYHVIFLILKNPYNIENKPSNTLISVFKRRTRKHFSIQSNRLKIKRDDLYPLITHFWQKHKNV